MALHICESAWSVLCGLLAEAHAALTPGLGWAGLVGSQGRGGPSHWPLALCVLRDCGPLACPGAESLRPREVEGSRPAWPWREGPCLQASSAWKCLCVRVPLPQSHLTLCDPLTCSPPDSAVHGLSLPGFRGGLPCPPPGDLPHPGITHRSSVSPALAGGFCTTEPRGKAMSVFISILRKRSSVFWGFVFLGFHWPGILE